MSNPWTIKIAVGAAVLAAIGAAAAPGAQASVISWSASLTYTSADGVAAHAYSQLIAGTPAVADYYNSGGNFGAQTVVDTLTSTNITFNYTTFSGGGDFAGPAPTTGDTALNTVLTGGYQGASGTSNLSFTIGGLTAGTAYDIQLWSDSEGMSVQGSSTYYAASSSHLSWFITGAFTADASTQSITLTQGGTPVQGRPSLAAYLVTAAPSSPASVPEPYSAVLLATGLLGLGVARRRWRGSAYPTPGRSSLAG